MGEGSGERWCGEVVVGSGVVGWRGWWWSGVAYMISKVVFGALLHRTKQVGGFKSLGMQRNVVHRHVDA